MQVQFKNAYRTKDKNGLPMPMFVYAIVAATNQELDVYKTSVEARPNGKVIVDENQWADGMQTIKNPFHGKILVFAPSRPFTNQDEPKDKVIDLDFTPNGTLIRRGSEDDLFKEAFKSVEITNQLNTEARVAASQSASGTKRPNAFAIIAERKAAEEAARLAAEAKANAEKTAETTTASAEVGTPVGPKK